MRIVKIKGGLGNQLFQYSFAYLLQKKTQEEVKIDMQTYRDLMEDSVRRPRLLEMNTTLGVASEKEIRDVCIFKHTGNMLKKSYKIGIAAEGVLNPKYYFERDRRYREIDGLLKFQYFDGYWQAWRYVDETWNELAGQFQPKHDLHPSTIKMIEEVSGVNSVFIGVRRGDYLGRESHFGSFGQDYYDQAIKIIKEKVPNPVFYVFSNDVPWVRNHLKFDDCNVIYREPQDVIDDFEDLLIMAACKHAIIINSTYHWWGARLKDYDGKIVVAPKQWFFDQKPIDIVPPAWIRVSP